MNDINTGSHKFVIERELDGTYFVSLINRLDFFYEQSVEEEDVQSVVDTLIMEYEARLEKRMEVVKFE